MSNLPILAGTLADLDLPAVMEVTSLGRQMLRLEVASPTGALIGFVVLKAGRVVSATAGSQQGQAALATIMAAEGNARFRIVRETSALPLNNPLGMVDDVSRFPRASVPSMQPISKSAVTGSTSRVRVMEGSLSEFDVPTLLQTIGMGRQFMELDILQEDGRAIGSVFLKAGKVVSAQSGNMDGIGAIRELMDSPKNFQFAVFRIDAEVPPPPAQPVGSLTQVLFDAQPRTNRPTAPAPAGSGDPARQQRPTAPAPNAPTAAGSMQRVAVMKGLLSEFDVPTILQTVGAGRQYIGIELSDGPKVLGAIYAKAGMLISAQAPGLSGVSAFRVLVQSPAHCQFSVFRCMTDLPLGEPLGALYKLLLSVGGDASADHGAVPVSAPYADSDRVTSISPDRVPVMAGQISDVAIRTLLETLTFNRQRMIIELTQAGKVLGTIVVKAGQLLSAKTDTRDGVAGFTWLLGVPPDCQFRVYRSSTGDVGQSLGSLYELLTAQAPSPPPMRAQILQPRTTQATAEVAAPRSNRMVILVTTVVAVAAAAGVLFTMRSSKKDKDQTPAVAMAPAATDHAAAPAPPDPTADKAAQPPGMTEQDKAKAVDEAKANEAKAAEDAKANEAKAAEDAKAQKLAEQEAAKKAAEDAKAASAKAAEDAKAQKMAEQEAAKKAAEDAKAQRIAEAEAAKKAAAEAKAAELKAAQDAKAQKAAEAEAARKAAQEAKIKAAQDAKAREAKADSGSHKVATWKVQAMLKKLGYPVGPVDNIAGKLTKAAIMAFQKDQSLQTTGSMDDETMKALSDKAPVPSD